MTQNTIDYLKSALQITDADLDAIVERWGEHNASLVTTHDDAASIGAWYRAEESWRDEAFCEQYPTNRALGEALLRSPRRYYEYMILPSGMIAQL